MRSALNRGANKNSLFDQNIEASVGQRTANLSDFFFSKNGRWVNVNMTVPGSDIAIGDRKLVSYFHRDNVSLRKILPLEKQWQPGRFC